MRSIRLFCSAASAAQVASRRTLACAAAAACAMMSGGAVHAASLTWSGTGADQFFGTAENWTSPQSPTAADDVFFPAVAVAPAQTPLWEAADSVLSIAVDNSGGFVWQLPRSGSVNPRSISIGSGGLTISGGGTTTWGAISTTAAVAQTWNIGSGTTLQFLSGATPAGAGRITKTGDGTIQFFSPGTAFSGGWDITAGMLTNGSATTNSYGTGATTISGTGVLNLNINVAGAVSGGALTLANGGTLSGNTGSLVTGDTGVPSITPAIGVDTAANTSVFIKSTQAGSNFRLAAGFTGGTSHDDSVIRVQGPGEVHLLNGNTGATAFLGTWKVETGGTLRAESTSSLGVRNNNTPSRLELNGGTIRWAGTGSGSTAVTFTNPILVTGDSTMSMDKTGAAGTAVGSGNARTLGAMTIGANQLTVNVTSKITGASTGTTVRMGGNTVTLTGDATFNVIKPTGFDLTFNVSSISDGGSGSGYTKTGTGWMSVSGASTYSGPTNVLDGALFLNNTGALGQTSALHVGAGAVANLTSGVWTSKANLSGGGTISLAGGSTMTLQGSEIAPGDSAGVLSVTGNLALDLDGAERSRLAIGIDGGGAIAGIDYDRLAVSGTITGLANADLFVDIAPTLGDADLAGDTLIIVTSSSNFTGLSFNSVTFADGASGQVHYNNGSITIDNLVAPVPEPAAAATLLLAAGMGLMRRRKR